MRLFISLLFCVIGFPVIAHADCRFVPYKEVKTADEAAALFTALPGKAYTCGIFPDEYGKKSWGCEQNNGECDLVSNLGLSRQNREGRGFTSGGHYRDEGWYDKGWYETWPSGQRVYCDRFGCRSL